jgi:hypothetical protein
MTTPTMHSAGAIEILTTSDDHRLQAYVARPNGSPRGAVVLLQEIFGINSHVRHKADEYAAQGWLAVAPGLFDRVEPGLVLSYADIPRGMACLGAITEEMLLADLQAGIDFAAEAGPVSVIDSPGLTLCRSRKFSDAIAAPARKRSGSRLASATKSRCSGAPRSTLPISAASR